MRIPNLTKTQWRGAGILCALLLFAIGEKLLFKGNPNYQDLSAYFAAPTLQEPLGYDQYGRSMLARMGAALRLSFGLSLVCVLTAAFIGTGLGVLAAWNRLADNLLNLVVNIVMALPGLVLILLLGALVPGSFVILYLGIALVLWVEYFRLVRALSLRELASPALQASQLMGFSKWYLFKRHLWPSLAPAIFTLSAFGAANAILALAALGFVYVGLKPPTAELGLMLVELFPYYSDAPWILIQPLIAIFLLVLGFNWLAGQKVDIPQDI